MHYGKGHPLPPGHKKIAISLPADVLYVLDDHVGMNLKFKTRSSGIVAALQLYFKKELQSKEADSNERNRTDDTGK